MQTIPLAELSIVFIPTIFLLAIMFHWRLKPWVGLYANARMLLQLLLVGYFLTYVFETTQPLVIVALVILMIAISSWIALRSFEEHKPYLIVLISIGGPGLILLGVVTQLVLELPRWFEPNMVVPIAGMIFANSMNTVSLAAERFESEFKRGESYISARKTALDAALIPQINSLFAVGLVALPGMMTGQILSGVDPIVAVRYQIMVMWMIFGSGGIAAVIYLVLRVQMVKRSDN
ncbi:MAG: ABC transporter permease [Nitrospinae bacterium]|nr:ABC transporter permease [Nitrospinota bacterium]MBL7019262.1 ABC transporter permease [Nitrospinaceae bacterium]